MNSIREILKNYNLKVTPQRILVYEALVGLNNHPTAEILISKIQSLHPNISTATIYKTLDTFAKVGLINKVKTDKDIMRYDAITEKHHHIYCEDTGEIIDYYNKDLNNLIENYFSEHVIPDFDISEVNVQISGKKNNNNN